MSWKGLRLGLGGLGTFMILVPLAADKLGLVHSPTFGPGKILLFLTGVGPLAAALLGPRLPKAWSGGALMMVNTLVLFGVLESSLIVWENMAGSSWRQVGLADQLTEHYLTLPYYQAQEWATVYWQEENASKRRWYQPYVGWRRAPYHGQTIHIDEHSRRVVPGTACSSETYRVFTFGGSTMWGIGSPDEGTIPAWLQTRLEERLARPVCVVNFGESAWVSNQGLIALTLQLETGEYPDLVVFYDGLNDVLSAHQSGLPGMHQNLSEVAARFNNPARPFRRWFENLRTIQMVRRWGAPTPPTLVETLSSELARGVERSYLGTVDCVRALAEHHGFGAVFFWQPYILVGGKPLTSEEQRMVDGVDHALNLDPRLRQLVQEVWPRMATRVGQNPDLHDLSGVFDHREELLWIDTWGHVTPEGNRLVAEAMMDVLEERWQTPQDSR